MHIYKTGIMTMRIILVWLQCLLLFCMGADVGLNIAPSAVTESGSLTLTCTVTQNRSLFASFNFVNWTRIGFVKLLEGRCVPSVRSTGQFCNQECSCDTNGTSFSWTIPNVTSDWNNTQIRCYMVTPDVTTSAILMVHVLPPLVGTTSSTTEPKVVDPGTNTVLVISVTCAVVLVAVIATSVLVFYCRRKRRSCFSREDNNLNQARGMTEQSELENGDYLEICQSTTYEDLNLADVAPSSEYDNIRGQGKRKQAEDSKQNTYEILGQTSAPDVYDDLIQ